MTKLRTLLATALLALPVLSLSAAQLAVDSAAPGKRFEPTSLTGCCPVFFNGRWYCWPC